jgi:hypothetical protein
MQINNWSDLLANKRLSKTVRDENNDLIILGTQTKATFKKQDQWQPYAMTVADLAAAIGGGGGGVSFALKSGNFIQLQEQVGEGENTIKSTSFTPAENSVITISAISIPNGLRWRGEFTTGTPADGLGDYLQNDVVYTDLGSPSLYKTWFALDDQTIPGATAPPTSGVSNAFWGQLGVEGNPGVDGFRTAILTLYKWVNSGTAPSTSLPTGSAAYTWATGLWTVSGVTVNGWTTTIPAPTPGYHLYKIDTLLTNNNTDPSSTVSISGSPVVEYLSYAGANGGAIINMGSTENASFIVAATAAGTLVKCQTGASTNIVVTVNGTTLSGMAIGAQTMFVWDSGTGGSVSFVAAGGASITSANSMTYTRTVGSFVTLIKSSATVFYLVGDLAPY